MRCGGCGGGGAGTGDSDIVGEQFPFDMFNWFSLALKRVEVLLATAGWQLDTVWEPVKRGQVGHHEFVQKMHLVLQEQVV